MGRRGRHGLCRVSAVLGATTLACATSLAAADKETSIAAAVGGVCMQKAGVTLWVPGPWADRKAFIEAVAASNGAAVLAAGPMMFDAAKTRHALFDVLARDEALAQAMYVGSGRALDAPTRAAIEAHKAVACLTIEDTGEGLAERLQTFAGAVRAAGGAAVKVHKSGLSHPWSRWSAMLGGEQPAGLLQALVLQVPYRDQQRLCSFGMSQLGLADGCVADEGSDAEPAWVLFEFNIYCWQSRPDLATGQTFSRNRPGAGKYTLAHVADRRYPEAHDYFNPHGVWELDPG